MERLDFRTYVWQVSGQWRDFLNLGARRQLLDYEIVTRWDLRRIGQYLIILFGPDEMLYGPPRGVIVYEWKRLCPKGVAVVWQFSMGRVAKINCLKR